MTPPLDIDGKPVECGMLYWYRAGSAGDLTSPVGVNEFYFCGEYRMRINDSVWSGFAGWQFQRAIEPAWPERGA